MKKILLILSLSFSLLSCSGQSNFFWSHSKPFGGGVPYGNLYNWYAVTDVKNIANTGWHVPSDEEWGTLFTTLGGVSIAGGHLKESGYIYWDSPNTGADNSSGFNGRGTGTREGSTGIFSGNKQIGFWWSTMNINSTAKEWALLYNNAGVASGLVDYKFGHAIRLIKDNSTDPGIYIGNDGKIYNTVKIGDQVWVSENSREKKYRDGSDIIEVTDNATWAALTTGARCIYVP